MVPKEAPECTLFGERLHKLHRCSAVWEKAGPSARDELMSSVARKRRGGDAQSFRGPGTSTDKQAGGPMEGDGAW
jgi:hypothetical protein